MKGTLREISIPRFALRRDEAAAALAISPSTFDSWIKRGLMPEGKPIGGVTLWDATKVREAWQRLADGPGAEDDGDRPFRGRVV
ncbi:helix-turn-helix transcriptional regulator [Rhizobium leguminosarum]